MIFCVNVEHSIAIAEHFKAAGIVACHLDGNTHSGERADVMDRFRCKRIQILTNCALFDEGLDIPSLDGVILARPTQSLSRFLQMVGRALRPSEGKEHAIIVDLADNYIRHGLPNEDRVWTLAGVERKPKKGSKLVRHKNTGEVEEVAIDLTPTGYQLIEVPEYSIESSEHSIATNHIKIDWIYQCNQLLSSREMYDLKPGWCVYRLMESTTKPPLEAWQYLGNKLGYRPGWAKYKVDEYTTKRTEVVESTWKGNGDLLSLLL